MELSQYLTQDHGVSGGGNASANAANGAGGQKQNGSGASGRKIEPYLKIGSNYLQVYMYLGGHVTSDDVKAEPWYYGHITRSDCDQILTEKGQDGDYIIRESETNVRNSQFKLSSF